MHWFSELQQSRRRIVSHIRHGRDSFRSDYDVMASEMRWGDQGKRRQWLNSSREIAFAWTWRQSTNRCARARRRWSVDHRSAGCRSLNTAPANNEVVCSLREQFLPGVANIYTAIFKKIPHRHSYVARELIP